MRVRRLHRSAVFAVLAGLLAMWVPNLAKADGIYWANAVSGTIGSSNVDGTGANQSFITGAGVPVGVAVAGN